MMKNPKSKKNTRKYIIFAISALLVVSTILYMLAYRYLIERAEAAPASDSAGKTAQAKVTATSIESNDWSYKSEDIEISIEEVSKGSGASKVTYFVADVKLQDSSKLASAFAKNTFGRNIVETTSEIAKDNNAIFAINGDYYGFRGDGILIRNGQLYRENPTRTGAAFLNDGRLESFDETKVSAQKLISQGATNTLSFGPVLIKDGVVANNLESAMIDTNFGNHSIQGNNPRTGVGMIEPNHFVFIVVDGRMENYSRGMTLTEFAEVFKELGCTEAYNLDGGGSSTMYFMGRVVNNPLGEGKERRISDILYIKE